MKHPLAKLAPVLLLTVGVLVPTTLAEDTQAENSLEERREEARVERLWNLNWRAFVNSFVEHEGEYICVPGYERDLPSSTGQSISDYRSKSVWQQTFKDERGEQQTRKLTKPEADAFAAVAMIPEIEVGQYGYIHSGQIEDIIDGKTVQLEDIWLVDSEAVNEEKKELKEKLWGQVLEDIEDAIRDRARKRGGKSSRRLAENEAIDWGFESREQAIRRQRDSVFTRYDWVVKGFATDRLKEDARWPSAKSKEPGLQLIIVSVEDRAVTAVPAASLRKGITELQFIDYLQTKEMNKAAFIELVTEAKREHRGEYVAHVLAALTGEESPVAKDDEDGEGGFNNEVELAD